MREINKKFRILIFSLCAMIVIVSFFIVRSHSRGTRSIIIGAKNCTEQHILAEILCTMIEDQTDIKVKRRFGLEGTTVSFQSICSSGIDLYFEYTGTALLGILKETKIPENPFTYLRETFLKKYQLRWLDRLGFTNQYGLVVRSEDPYKVISDLEKDPSIRVAFDPEFTIRIERDMLKQAYPIQGFQNPKQMDQVLLYLSLLSHGVDVISVSTTDGRLCDESFTILIDEKECLPRYEVAPLMREDAFQKFPEVASLCKTLSGKISSDEMRRLNYEAEFNGREIKEIVRDFLEACKF